MTAQDHDETARHELDALFKALSSQTRRYILQALAKNTSSSASDLALDELGIATSDQVASQQSALHHLHLPQLEQVGLIEWETETGVVTPGPRFEDFQPLIELVVEFEDEVTEDSP